jgi:hypothetical protein
MRFPIGLFGASQHKCEVKWITLSNPVHRINRTVSKNVAVDSPKLGRALLLKLIVVAFG